MPIGAIPNGAAYVDPKSEACCDRFDTSMSTRGTKPSSSNASRLSCSERLVSAAPAMYPKMGRGSCLRAAVSKSSRQSTRRSRRGVPAGCSTCTAVTGATPPVVDFGRPGLSEVALAVMSMTVTSAPSAEQGGGRRFRSDGEMALDVLLGVSSASLGFYQLFQVE